ncbi:NAD(P)-binding protein [Fusarium subglutinans]|uniref:NAD(P)-binding protein n=1 Tax=Gibberella subglutinans TaxID=42677 RepID=A0A8H5UN13_GIBSU|nr:NAD(P)-binding protein [Fusarium subglutinans]KAF5592653.1 NAD(P)-binding protein [Fusarium subglutinans]
MANNTDLKIFYTGATGYLGGDAWALLIEKHPEWEARSTLLVRNEERGKVVKAKYPGARLQMPTSLFIVRIEDPHSSQALSNGLAKRRRDGSAYWVALSGTDNITWRTIEEGSYGTSYDHVYDDMDRVSEVTSLPDQAPHRDVEKIQQQCITQNPSVNLAIVCPSCVYGVGEGCGNQRSIQLPELAKYTIENGYAFKVGQGLCRWPNVHVRDHSRIVLSLIEDAMQGGTHATWGKDGYYFAENGEHVWGDIARLVAEEAKKQGLVDNANVKSFSAEEIDTQLDFGSAFYGTDSRCKAKRDRQVLGWRPQQDSLEAEIAKAVTIEGRSLGK